MIYCGSVSLQCVLKKRAEIISLLSSLSDVTIPPDRPEKVLVVSALFSFMHYNKLFRG